MTALNASELRDATRTRDSIAGHFEVRATDADAWLANLKADVALDAITDGIIYLAITSGPAKLEDVEGKWSAGGSREAPTFSSRYVTASYIARGQVNVLSAYCGVVWTKGEGAPAFAADKSQETGQKVSAAWTKLDGALSQYPELQVRTGSALHLHNYAEPWVAHPDQGIEVPDTLTCGVCGCEIHYASGRWRGADGKFDVYSGTNALGRGKSTFDHTHGPEVAE
jgi:hypothetical protein